MLEREAGGRARSRSGTQVAGAGEWSGGRAGGAGAGGSGTRGLALRKRGDPLARASHRWRTQEELGVWASPALSRSASRPSPGPSEGGRSRGQEGSAPFAQHKAANPGPRFLTRDPSHFRRIRYWRQKSSSSSHRHPPSTLRHFPPSPGVRSSGVRMLARTCGRSLPSGWRNARVQPQVRANSPVSGSPRVPQPRDACVCVFVFVCYALCDGAHCAQREQHLEARC